MAHRLAGPNASARRSRRGLATPLCGVLLCGVLVGCSAAAPARKPTVSTTAVVSSPSAPPPPTTTDAIAPARYELGGKTTTQLPVPKCVEAVAFWTAALGPVEVTVNADGPTSVVVVVNRTITQSANIGPGEDTHNFKFSSLNPASVKIVKVTATDSPQETGGSCIATGSPNN